MNVMSRRAFLASAATAAALCAAGCASAPVKSASSSSAASSSSKHVIGVPVYNVSDSEVLMFKEYLVNYIAGTAFNDVQFVYSGSITTEEQYLSFIDDVAALGGEGLMCFLDIDLKSEVERAASHGMYHIMASGTVSEENFAKVADNEFFLGCVGPGINMEYNAGSNMVRNYVANKQGDRYFIMSGGSPARLGNEMHYQRTLGILDALETGYGVDLGQTKELAAVAEPTTIEAGGLTVTIAPGYVAREGMRESVVEAFQAGSYDVVLSALPIEPIRVVLERANVKIAQVDCYSQDNQLLFASDSLSYLVGKYGSIVGPSFAALYNAIGGYAADFRENRAELLGV